MVTIEIVNGPLIPFPSDDTRKEDGAELIFNGRVRSTEHGRKITNLEYEQYEGMAENELMVRTVREAAGEDSDLMFDAWPIF